MPLPKIIQFPLGLTENHLQFHYVKTEVTSAEILAINAVPKVLVTAPGAGFILMPIFAITDYDYITAAYATNTDLSIVHNGEVAKLIDVQGVISQVADIIQTGVLSGLRGLISNKALELTELTGDPTGGDGTLTVYLWYINLEL